MRECWWQVPNMGEIWWMSIVAAIMSFFYAGVGLGLSIGKSTGVSLLVTQAHAC